MKPDPTKSVVAAEPLPNPADLPDPAQRVLDRCIAGMRAVLATQPRPQTEAYCHQTFDDPDRPMQSAVGGDSLRMVPYKPPINANGQPSSQAVRELAEASRAAGITIRMFRIRFRWDGASWQHELAIETYENYKRLTSQREPFDAEIAAALVAFVDTQRADWSIATLSFDASPDAMRPGLTVILPYPRPVTAIPPSSELQSIFDRVQQLHARFGRSLHTASWRVERKTPVKVDVNTYYG
jgi:hypothetical protein